MHPTDDTAEAFASWGFADTAHVLTYLGVFVMVVGSLIYSLVQGGWTGLMAWPFAFALFGLIAILAWGIVATALAAALHIGWTVLCWGQAVLRWVFKPRT